MPRGYVNGITASLDKTQRYLDALANLVQGLDLDPPRDCTPKLRIIKGGAA